MTVQLNVRQTNNFYGCDLKEDRHRSENLVIVKSEQQTSNGGDRQIVNHSKEQERQESFIDAPPSMDTYQK